MNTPIDQERVSQWVERVLTPILKEDIPLQEDIEGLGGLALLSADADKIKEYVFESAKLPEIRGGSLILDHLNQEKSRKVFEAHGLPVGFIDQDPPGCVAFAGGGSLLALVPLAAADDLRRDIETLYPDTTGTATITSVWEPWIPDKMSFPQAVERVGAKLRRGKEEKTTLPFFESPPLVRRCDSCRRRPAVRFDPDPEGGEVARCRVCYGKWTWGRDRKSRWHQEFEARYSVSAKPAKDLEDIARHSDGYIGFVYADGNGLGDWVTKANTPEEYRKRSRAVHESVGEAVYKAINCHLGPTFDHKFEVITIGGDDALLIVPAAWALAIARDMCREFAIRMGEWGYLNRTMSAGVVIADHHTPVYFLRRMAEALLKSAKGEADKYDKQGTVDFLVLKTQSMLATDLAHLRSTEPWSVTDEPTRTQLYLSHGPYTLSKLDQLLALVHQGRTDGFPRSQLYALRRVLSHGRFISTLFFVYQQARAREDMRAFLQAFQTHWCPTPCDPPPWERMPDRRGWHEYRTVWADLTEVWDFAKEGANAGTDRS